MMTDAFLKMGLSPSCDPELRKQEEQACNANEMYMCKAYYRQVYNVTDAEIAACGDVPVLVIRGADDVLVSSEDSKALAAVLPGVKGEVHEIPGAAHAPMLEAPNTVAALVEEFVRSAAH